jgi:hypothetical protein
MLASYKFVLAVNKIIVGLLHGPEQRGVLSSMYREIG